MINLKLTDAQAIELDRVLRDMRDRSTLPLTLADVQETLESKVDVILASTSMIDDIQQSDYQLLFRRELPWGLFTVYGHRRHRPNWLDRMIAHFPHQRVQVQGEWWHLLPSGWVCDRYLPPRQRVKN